MTMDTTEPVYHAGDLIGYNRAGQPLYLPGGGAQIVVDDKDDDDPDAFDEADPDDDGSDDDDEPDDEPDGEGEPPAKPRGKPSYKQLLEELQRLREGNSRNNRELMTRRHLGSFMRTHQIENLDAWLESLGVDKTTGKLQEGTDEPPPAATEPPEDPTGTRDNTTPPEAAPEAPEPVGEDKIARLVRLELAKQAARDNPAEPDEPGGLDRATILEEKAKKREVDTALRALGFQGKLETALRVLDLAGVVVDENGEVSGAEAAAQTLREEIPEWFRRPSTRVPPEPRGGETVDGGDKRTPTPQRKDWAGRVVENWQRGH